MFARTLAATVLLLLLAPVGLGEAATQGCLSGSCHQGLTKTRYLHGPVAAEMAGAKACVMCHLPAGPACTPTTKGSFKLKTRALCQTCHTKGTGTQHSQAEIESKCLKCHAPHGSETSRHFLRGDNGALPRWK